MNWLRIISIVALAGKLACGADDAAAPPGTAKSNQPNPPAVRLPRVLNGLEPKDSRVVMLPGPVVPRKPAPAPAPARRPPPILVAPGWRPKGIPALPPAPEVVLGSPIANADNLRVLTSVVPAPRLPVPNPSPVLPVAIPAAAPAETVVANAPLSPPPDLGNAPVDLLVPLATPPAKTVPTALAAEPHRTEYPADFARESAMFCQREIGRWTLADARDTLGEPQRQRPAFADDSTEDGVIYAFRDPTSRYKELELDFGKESGILRSVFVYPWNLTWRDCRKLWGANVSATEGNKGRIFYSYVNRHLDVLVDRDGKVISLGLY
ncbi:MAG TPA: hypothetical protein VGZ73_07730 [Bryobacteraceae bacterium]|jgi:hypothetical protein|nr:hypothetical protein [Bryobacteraceae bacterium]